METERKTKKATFCCPHHGVLSGKVEYFSENFGTKRFEDIPVMCCPECKKYYTTFVNLLAIFKPQYKGKAVEAAQGFWGKSKNSVEIRKPYIVDLEKERKEIEHKKEEQRKAHEEKWIESIKNSRIVYHDEIIVSNKSIFKDEHKCPHCRQATQKECVRISQRGKNISANIRHCNVCNNDYITLDQYHNLEEKAKEKLKYFHYDKPFIRPLNLEMEESYFGKGRFVFIPKSAKDLDKYNYNHLPPHEDEFFCMSDEEYLWIMMYYQPEEYLYELKKKSFLMEKGYSTSVTKDRRRRILEKCVEEYGKGKVIGQLKKNIVLRVNQKNGEAKYMNALNVWRSDIWYIENELKVDEK